IPNRSCWRLPRCTSAPAFSFAPAVLYAAGSARIHLRRIRSIRPADMHSHRASPSNIKPPRPAVAIVGGESLLGKEVLELFESADLPATVSLIASEERENSNIVSLA